MAEQVTETPTTLMYPFGDEFAIIVDNALKQANRSRVAVLAIATEPIDLPPGWLRRTAARPVGGQDAFYWAQPTLGSESLALGLAAETVASGPQRVGDTHTQLQQAFAGVCGAHASARWWGGFSFAAGQRTDPWFGWPDARFVLPRFYFEEHSGSSTVTVSVALRPGDVAASVLQKISAEWAELLAQSPSGGRRPARNGGPSQAAKPVTWKQAVADSAREIQQGRYEKVVLARNAEVQLSGEVDLDAGLAFLERHYPDAYVFAIWHNGSCFLGASPERLVRVDHGSLEVDCLAGTRPRGAGAQEDDRLAEALMESTKDRQEHAVVLTWIQKEIADLVTDLEAPSVPQLRKLANVQHLHTPVSGRAKTGRNVLDFVQRLHPTPAVAGVPRTRVLPVISEREQMDRGWYAGAIGWVNSAGDGEFAVALRSALVQRDRATLYAGAGIMGDSDPESEWQETEVKLRPMQSALSAAQRGEA